MWLHCTVTYRATHAHTLNTHTYTYGFWQRWLLWISRLGWCPCGIRDAISASSCISPSPSLCVSSPCFSISYLCSRCHLFISLCPSLFISLLLFFPPPSDRGWQLPSGLFQAPAYTHTHSLTPLFSHFLSVFVTFSCNFCILLFDSVWMCLWGSAGPTRIGF